MECFDWWLNKIADEFCLPNLLRDQEGSWITDYSKAIFFPPSEDLTAIPSWHNVLLLHREDAESIDFFIRMARGKTDKREVISYLNFYNCLSFREYSAEALVTPLKNAINGEYERAIEFIRWVWQNDKVTGLTNSDVFFPCKDGSVQRATDVYLGREYGENTFIPYLKAGGKFELESPQIIRKDLVFRRYWSSSVSDCNEPDKQYLEHAETILKDFAGAEGDVAIRRVCIVVATTIENIYNILEKVPTVQVLKWIFGNSKNSAELKDSILFPITTETLYYLPDSKKINYREIKIQTKSHLWYVFAYTPWVTLGKNGKKYAPMDCKFASNNPLEAELLEETITDEILENFSKETETPVQKIKDLFESLGCDTYFLNLRPESFYDLLLKMPDIKNISESIKLSHLIYNNCVEALSRDDYYLERFADTPEGADFQKKGKLLCKNDHSYKPVKDIYFSSSSVLNPLNKALFDIPLKNGRTDSIVEVFKISPYDKEWETNIHVFEEDISESNEMFKREWMIFIPYVLCLLPESQWTSMISKFRNLNIDLISKLRNENGKVISLQNDDYHLMEEKKHYYIYIGNGDVNKYKLSQAIGDLLQKALNTENRERLNLYAELFRSDDESRRGLISDLTYSDALDDCINRFNAVNSGGNPIVNLLNGKGVETKPVLSILNRLYAGIELKVSEQERFADFLKANKMDVGTIRSVLDQDNVSIVGYNRKLLKAKFEEKVQRQIFEWALWREYRDGVDESRMDFRSRKETLNSDVLKVDVDNSVYFNPESKLDEIFKEMFGVSKDDFDANKETSCDSVDELYQRNRDALEVPDDIDVDAFLDDPKIKSLLYFDAETVQRKLIEYIEQRQREDSDTSHVHVSVPLNTEISYGDDLKASSSHNPSGGSRVITHSTRSASKENDSKLQNQGYEAEKVVVNELRQKAIADINKLFDNQDYDVEWKSKAAEYFEKTDGDDSLGYDILLRGADGRILYVDVKSHEGEDCSFMMSANEINFAKTHLSDDKDEYRIIFISNFRLGSGDLHPSINVLPANFLDDPRFEKEYPNVRIYLSQL